MKSGLKAMGLSYDWSRELATCDPSYFRHEQRMFLDFLAKGLAYRWESWAAPKTADGKVDHNKAMVGDDLRDFVDHRLFPYLMGFSSLSLSGRTLA